MVAMRKIREALRLRALRQSPRLDSLEPRHGQEHGTALPAPDGRGGRGLAVGSGVAGRSAGGAAVPAPAGGWQDAPGPGLDQGKAGTEQWERDAATPVTEIQSSPPRRGLPVHPALRVLPALEGPARSGAAVGPPPRPEDLQPLRRPARQASSPYPERIGIVGVTGTRNGHLACALAEAAHRHGPLHPLLPRLSRPLHDLALAHVDGSCPKLLGRLPRPNSSHRTITEWPPQRSAAQRCP